MKTDTKCFFNVGNILHVYFSLKVSWFDFDHWHFSYPSVWMTLKIKQKLCCLYIWSLLRPGFTWKVVSTAYLVSEEVNWPTQLNTNEDNNYCWVVPLFIREHQLLVIYYQLAYSNTDFYKRWASYDYEILGKDYRWSEVGTGQICKNNPDLIESSEVSFK